MRRWVGKPPLPYHAKAPHLLNSKMHLSKLIVAQLSTKSKLIKR